MRSTTSLDRLGRGGGRRASALDAVLLGRRQRLGDLAVVAVDGDGLEPELPGVDVELLDVFDRDLLGHVHGLGDGARDERLHRAHHPHVARGSGWRCRPSSRRTPATWSAGQVRRAEDRLVARRCRRRCRRSARRSSRGGAAPAGTVWLTIDIVPPPTSFLILHEAEVGLDAGGVAVHHQADGAGGRQHRWPGSCARRTPRPSSTASSHACWAARQQLGRDAAPRRCGRPRRGACRAPAACAPRSRRSRRTGPCGPAVRADVA